MGAAEILCSVVEMGAGASPSRKVPSDSNEPRSDTVPSMVCCPSAEGESIVLESTGGERKGVMSVKKRWPQRNIATHPRTNVLPDVWPAATPERPHDRTEHRNYR